LSIFVLILGWLGISQTSQTFHRVHHKVFSLYRYSTFLVKKYYRQYWEGPILFYVKSKIGENE
jgi:hypothetical protein